MAVRPFVLTNLLQKSRFCGPERIAFRTLTTSATRLASRSSSPAKASDGKHRVVRANRAGEKQEAREGKVLDQITKYSKDNKSLIQKGEDGRSLDVGQRLDVPMKVLPKAELSPNLTLSPKERLHIEYLTRRPPPQTAPKVFKERLLIYHAGHARVNWLALWRVAALVGLSAVTVIIAPAHYQHGTPLPIVALIWAAGFVPLVTLNWWFRGIVTHVWLNIPQHARQTARTAIDYAKSLPRDASLDLNFLRATALMGTVHLKVYDTIPVKRLLRPATFRWIGPRVNSGSWLRPNPTEFYVRPESAKGKAARDTIPGLWKKVYSRLAGVEGGTVSKWRQ